MMATKALGDRNFLAPLQSYGITYTVTDPNAVMWCMTIEDYVFSNLLISSVGIG